MTYPADYRASLGLRQETDSHDSRDSFGATGSGEALSDASIAGGLQQQFAHLDEVLAVNQSAYANRRAALHLTNSPILVISDIGKDQLFNMGLRARGTGAPIFRYFAPKSTGHLRAMARDDIKWMVMHSFGRGFDARALRNGQRTVSIDPLTGHNPRRFINGLNTLVNGTARNASDGETALAAIHHAISLRGDVVNSVPWDTACVHGEGGHYQDLGINAHSIGIEHEEWMAAPAPSRGHSVERRFREIQDHGPYSEETYSCDAFIMKKLGAYTGRDYAHYLGEGLEARENIRNGVVGVFNHNSSSQHLNERERLVGHADPGGDFFLPPEYELRVTPFSSMAATKGRPGAWQERIEIWYSTVPDGTRISAYARIFEKVGRLRSFNLQTDVFDPTIAGGVISLTPPTPTGTSSQVLAQTAARDRVSAAERSVRAGTSSRVELYAAAGDTSSAVQLAMSRASSRLGAIADHTLRLPVVVNALTFDFDTGLWSNLTSRAVTANVSTDPTAGPAPTADIDPVTVVEP